MKWIRALCLAALVAHSAQDQSAFAAAAPARGGTPSNVSDQERVREADATWRESAWARIEQHRKANLAVAVHDALGRPIRGATVTVRMKRHHFGFGAAIGATRWEDRPNAEDARRHRDLFAEHFNKAVTIPRLKPSTDEALDWLAERGLRVRGHYLMWAPIQPDRGRAGQPENAFDLPAKELIVGADEPRREAIREAAFTHIEQMLRFAGKRVAEWDAINHIALDNGVRYSDLFGTRIYADVIKRARELAPHAEMWVNEGAILTTGERIQKYHDVIAELIELGARPDGIGFMAHFREDRLTPPEEIYRRLDRFAPLAPKLQLTELDIDTSNEQLQADFMRDVLTIAFSHPAVCGIMLWHTWGHDEQQKEKALWRADWSIKPAGQVWRDHVFGHWWTNETGSTDHNGAFTTRGFVGDYEISVRVADRTRTVHGQLATGGGSFAVVF